MDYTVINLIEKVIEFNALTPNQNEWNDNSLAYNKPRLIRFKQIYSLLTAFEIIQVEDSPPKKLNIFTKSSINKSDITKNGIISILNGDFIRYVDLSLYNELIALIEKYSILSDEPVTIDDLKIFYNHIIKYKISMQKLIEHNSGILESSFKGSIAAIRYTKEINKKLEVESKKIDNLIWRLVDPLGRKFTEQELDEKFNFPSDNLFQIDMDYT